VTYTTPDGIDSTFRFILVAAKRAEQLVTGARPRMGGRHAKPTLIALDEVVAGLVPWQPLTAEQYDLLRQQELMGPEPEETPPVLLPPRELISEIVDELETGDEDDFDADLDDPDFSGDELDELEEPAEELLEGDEPKE
jgi:DNA-directed RNA polymerase subunit omega